MNKIAAVILCALVGVALAGDFDNHAATWASFSQAERQAYLAGFQDGVFIGAERIVNNYVPEAQRTLALQSSP